MNHKRIFFTLLITSTLSMNLSASVANSAQWKKIETISYDWRADGHVYNFTLLTPPNYGAGSELTRLDISHRGKIVYSLDEPGGLTNYADVLKDGNKSLAKKNILKSQHLLMISSIKGRSKSPLLLLFGWPYASDPGSLHIVALDNDGVPREILALKHFYINSFIDLDHDFVPELIGKRCFTQPWGPNDDIFTYDPFSVYRFGAKPASRMILDEKLTEAYNKQNYYGWAGPECSGDIAVVLHPPGGGKPVVMDAEKAKALFTK